MKIQWSDDAPADLNRIATFLTAVYPSLAARLGPEIASRIDLLRQHPHAGRPIGTKYREIVLIVLKGAYVFQYEVKGDTILVLRVFHGREKRT